MDPNVIRSCFAGDDQCARNYMRAFEFTAERQLESKTVLNMSHRLLYRLATNSRARGTREFDPSAIQAILDVAKQRRIGISNSHFGI